MERKKFFIFGGDERNIELARLLIKDGQEVLLFGFEKLDLDLPQSKDPFKDGSDADIIISGLPMSKDQKTLNAPFSSREIFIEELLELLSNEQIFTAGKIGKEFFKKRKDIKIEDYFMREEMQVSNAIPTAEGAIQIAMEEMQITLHKANTMVLGYGRIGKALSKMLLGIGANVYVEARSYDDLAWVQNNGYIPVHLRELSNHIGRMDVIFNTIPSTILDENLLNKVCKDCILIDLASKPGGIDWKKAEELDRKAISAIGLPGKVAPITAATIIKDTIYNIITEGGR